MQKAERERKEKNGEEEGRMDGGRNAAHFSWPASLSLSFPFRRPPFTIINVASHGHKICEAGGQWFRHEGQPLSPFARGRERAAEMPHCEGC